MPDTGTISVLTFNLINSLAKKQTRSNALFWLTVWLTAKGYGPWTTDRGYWDHFLFHNDYINGVGRRALAVVRGSRTLVDGLIEAVYDETASLNE